jgi:antitoxin component YwqK of YwqJK toxin-antitoxin module
VAPKIKKEYYPTGQLRREMVLENGQLHGAYKSYFENGQLKIEAAYRN